MVNNNIDKIKAFRLEGTRFMMPYKFALDEINTKVNILKEEFTYLHDYNPIEYVSSRVKSVESIIKKVHRKDIDLSLQSIKEEILDIAGVRITCSFISDIYKLKNMIQGQKDVEVIDCKDYIKNPKPNGYRSLHLLVKIPIFMSDKVEIVPVEIQIRTIAMDFWASLEHKIFYKYNKDIPKKLLDELKDTATTSFELDVKMEHLNDEINKYKQTDKKEIDNIYQSDHDSSPIIQKIIQSIEHNNIKH